MALKLDSARRDRIGLRTDLERIVCRGCGHTDPAPEGAALIFSLRAPCPRCGGRDSEFVPAGPIRRVA